MKKVATKEIDGTLYPVEWAVDQCPYGQSGQGCDLGGTCLLRNGALVIEKRVVG